MKPTTDEISLSMSPFCQTTVAKLETKSASVTTRSLTCGILTSLGSLCLCFFSFLILCDKSGDFFGDPFGVGLLEQDEAVVPLSDNCAISSSSSSVCQSSLSANFGDDGHNFDRSHSDFFTCSQSLDFVNFIF